MSEKAANESSVSHTAAQKRGIRNTLIQLGLIIAVILALFFWKLNREAVVKPQGAPQGFVKLEQAKPLPNWPVQGRWSIGLMDAPNCEPASCNPARLTLQRLWEGNQRLPRDQVDLVWFTPESPSDEGSFITSTVSEEFSGISDIGWFVEGDWQRWSHSLVIVDPQGAAVAWVRPPFNAGQIVRSMSLAGIQ